MTGAPAPTLTLVNPFFAPDHHIGVLGVGQDGMTTFILEADDGEASQ